MEVIRKDVVVIGLGAFGSAALWRLAQLGIDVAGIERHGIGNHLGSSHGATRLFRIACQEHPGLAPIAVKSLELWTGLGDQIGERLVRQSGCLSTGSPESRPVSGAIAAAAAAGIPILEFSHEELAARQPQYAGLGIRSDGAGIDPEEMDRYIHLDTDIDELSSCVSRALPGLDPRPAKVIPCVVTDSPDRQFLVGRLN